ncbi:MAG TPA: DinB family protein [Vicinamibacterales bacterium]|nr:DinB family protein [Vicinamibacterales bacterium]
MRRAFLVLSGALILTSAALAQSGGDDAAAVRAGFTELSDWIVKSAELIPADKYTYQPVKTVRTVGQQIAHIIDGQNYYCGRAAGQKVEWSDATEKGATDKATLLPRLKQSMQTCAALHAGAFRAPLVGNLGHGSLHYGNLVTYMRMLGLKPPSS